MAAGGYSEPKMAMGYKFPPKFRHYMVFRVSWGGGGGKDIRDRAVFVDIAGIYLTHHVPKVFYYYVLIRYCKGCTFGLTHS